MALEGQLAALQVVDEQDEDEASDSEEEGDGDDHTDDPSANPVDKGDDNGGDEE